MAHNLKMEVKKFLIKKSPKPNLGIGEREAVRKLKEDDTIVILPADKGNVTVVMDRTEYQRKMQVLLEEGSYRTSRGDPTSKLEKEVNKKLKELWTQGEIDKETYNRLRSSFCSTPQMYELPKIHKPGTPLRPIVSNIGSATYNLAKELTTIMESWKRQTRRVPESFELP